MKHRATVPETWETASESGSGSGTQDSATATVTVGRHAGPALPEDEEADQPSLGQAAAPDSYIEYTQQLTREFVCSAPRPGAHTSTVQVVELAPEPAPEPTPDPPADPGPEPETVEESVADLGEESAPPKDVEPLPSHVIPDSARWKSRHLGRTLLSIATVAALMATVPTAVYYWQMRSDDRMNLLVVMCTFAIGLWSILASRRRQVVLLRGSLLTVQGRCIDETFDLADALQRVELSGHPRKLRWSLTLARTDKSELVLRRRDVDAIQLEPIVRYYRVLAERRRDRQWNELGLHGATR